MNEFVEIYKRRSNINIDDKQGMQHVKNEDTLDIKQRNIVSAIDLDRKAS